MNKKQILVVEDEGLIAKDLQMMLRRLGYHVPVTVGTGELAIQTAIQNDPDLILMDIQLRGNMDGVQATEAIKSVKDIPVVFLTANSDELNFQRAKSTDPFAFLIKPFEERGLQAAIEMALYKNKTERLIREREQWLSTTMKSIADGVITTDEQGRITFLNIVAEKLLGWNNDESSGRHHAEIFSLKDEDSTKTPPDVIANASMTNGIDGSRCNHTLLARRSGGDIPIKYSVAQIRNNEDSIAGYVIVFSDVTQQRKLEEEIRQAQKMEVIGKLAGSIAHDFNNALTAIMGYSSLILSKLTDDDPIYGDASEVMHAAEHSARLTSQLLAFSRKEILHPVRLNLGKAIHGMHGLVRRLIRENIAITISAPDDLWDVSADRGHCEQLVFNMAINARDAMPDGGKLSIDVKNVYLTADVASRMKSGREGEFVAIKISDTGMGMTPEIIERIFEPFFTTKGRDYGTGLGLSTCDGIVRQVGGFIHVASVPGAGTTFTVYFPRMETSDTQVEPSLAAAPCIARGSETVLLVEDEEAVRNLSARVLKELGYTVIEAENGSEALLVLKNRAKEIDLIITDLVMPDMSGRALVEALQNSFNGSKVLLISGYTDDTIIRDSIFLADVPFLPKPFTPGAFASKVREVLETKF